MGSFETELTMFLSGFFIGYIVGGIVLHIVSDFRTRRQKDG